MFDRNIKFTYKQINKNDIILNAEALHHSDIFNHIESLISHQLNSKAKNTRQRVSINILPCHMTLCINTRSQNTLSGSEVKNPKQQIQYDLPWLPSDIA